MPRRTVKLAELVALVNQRNRISTCAPDVRNGWNSLLEEALHTADAYHGFGYLTANEVPAGHQPGMAGEQGKRTFPDESRRCYIFRK